MLKRTEEDVRKFRKDEYVAGMRIIELAKNHKYIGVYGIGPDDSPMRYWKSAFHYRDFNDALMECNYLAKGETFENTSYKYDMYIFLKIVGNCERDELKFKELEKNNKPCIILTLCVKEKEFDPTENAWMITDCIVPILHPIRYYFIK